MSKIFPSFPEPSPGPSGRTPRRPLSRALLFALALVLLWGATQLMPSPPQPSRAPAALYSDASGTVAASTEDGATPRRDRSLFHPGYLGVLLVLGGGIWLAVYLRKRQAAPGGPAPLPLQSLGHLQLAPQQQLRLVGCGDDLLLLGVTAGQITLLKTYPRSALETPEPPAPVAAPATDDAPDVLPKAAPFADLLRAFSQRPVNTQASQAL